MTEADFGAAQRDLVPSVSGRELGYYERVRRDFEKVDEKVGVGVDEEGIVEGTKGLSLGGGDGGGTGKGKARMNGSAMVGRR